MTARLLTATTEHTQTSIPHHAAEETTHSSGPHLSIKAEPVFYIGSFPVPNSLLTSLVILVLFTLAVLKYKSDAAKPKKTGYFYFMTFIMRGVYNLFQSALGEKTDYFFPIVGAFFFYILLNNWSGLVPGVGTIMLGHVPLFRANTADLNATVALALVSVSLVQYYGVSHLGLRTYLSKFLNFSNPVGFFVGILEIISELSRILSFAFRLFGNIFAGEVLLTVVASLIPVLASLPFYLLETFVGLIQAVVFAMLSAILFRLAITHESH